MICPICNKEINIKEYNINKIIELIKTKPMSIAKLVRALNIKRSTLIYYLNIMESQGIIEKERQEKEVTGRPTIVKFKDKLK